MISVRSEPSCFFFPSFVFSGVSWGYLILLYVYVQVSRAVVVGVLFPFLQYFGYGLDLKEAIILSWSGLRGAVALSLSLSVKASWLVIILPVKDLMAHVLFLQFLNLCVSVDRSFCIYDYSWKFCGCSALYFSQTGNVVH